MDRKKVTVKELEKLTSHLNFLCHAIVPGRTFTRNMYAKFATKFIKKNGNQLKSYHHVQLDKEYKRDCNTWLKILENQAFP